jgi:hypothetical protein
MREVSGSFIYYTDKLMHNLQVKYFYIICG